MNYVHSAHSLVSPSVALAIAAALALAACNRDEAPKSASVAAATGELAWARAAVERNPDLEVIATDPQSGVVTVKHRSTGQIEAIKASELAAVTPSQLKPMNVQQAPPPEPEPGPVREESRAPRRPRRQLRPTAAKARRRRHRSRATAVTRSIAAAARSASAARA